MLGKVYGGGTFAVGTKIHLDAIPEPGYEFSGWGGGGTEPHLELEVESNKIYTACFNKKVIVVPVEKKTAAQKKVDSISDLNEAKALLQKIIEKGNDFIINLINEA